MWSYDANGLKSCMRSDHSRFIKAIYPRVCCLHRGRHELILTFQTLKQTVKISRCGSPTDQGIVNHFMM